MISKSHLFFEEGISDSILHRPSIDEDGAQEEEPPAMSRSSSSTSTADPSQPRLSRIWPKPLELERRNKLIVLRSPTSQLLTSSLEETSTLLPERTTFSKLIKEENRPALLVLLVSTFPPNSARPSLSETASWRPSTPTSTLVKVALDSPNLLDDHKHINPHSISAFYP